MSDIKIDLSKYENHLGRKHQMIRLLWSITWALYASWMPRSIGSGWKCFLLRTFGAKMGKNFHVYSSAKIYYPLNLVMGNNTCLASDGDCYKVAPIVLKDQAWIGVRALIGIGVTIRQGAVVGATASVYKNVEPWTVVGSSPAMFLKKRMLIKPNGGEKYGFPFIHKPYLLNKGGWQHG